MAIQNHNKLVRDAIPGIITRNCDTPVIRSIADDAEFLRALTAKLIEEAHEVHERPSLEELADALEVIRYIGAALGFEPEHIEAARRQKLAERGGFDDRIYLIHTESS